MLEYIRKNEFKILKYIIKHEKVTKEQLIKKFPKDLEENLNILRKNSFYVHPEMEVDKEWNRIIFDENWYLPTPEGKTYAELMTRDNRRWKIPVTISIIAVVISAISVTISILT